MMCFFPYSRATSAEQKPWCILWCQQKEKSIAEYKGKGTHWHMMMNVIAFPRITFSVEGSTKDGWVEKVIKVVFCCRHNGSCSAHTLERRFILCARQTIAKKNNFPNNRNSKRWSIKPDWESNIASFLLSSLVIYIPNRCESTVSVNTSSLEVLICWDIQVEMRKKLNFFNYEIFKNALCRLQRMNASGQRQLCLLTKSLIRFEE